MITKYKPEYEEELLYGVYFKSENDVSTDYLIQALKGRFEGSGKIKIWKVGIPDNYFNTDGLTNGSEVGFPNDSESEWLVTLELMPKYFFPTFSTEMQMYYDEEKYYEGKCKTNSITSLMECINFAIDYGLTCSGIKPY